MTNLRALLGVVMLQPAVAAAQSAEQPDRSPAWFSAGMGVSSVNSRDVVSYIRILTGINVNDFKSGVEFFGSASVPYNDDWTFKLEYAYLLGTYNVNAAYGAGEFTFTAHLPTLIGQYTLILEPTYAVRAGCGLGYHFGSMSVRYGPLMEDFSGQGMGAKLDLEATTAFSRRVRVYLGGDLRWDFIGDLTDSDGNSPPGQPATSLHFFSIGAKLGFTYTL